MTSTSEHTFSILKTQFLSERQNCDLEGVSLQMIDSSCLINYPMNRNNVLAGNNLIYVNGAYITFFNFFQNTKSFGMLVNSAKIVGMVGSNSGRGNVAVVSQNQDKSELYVSVYTFCDQFVPTHTIKHPLTFLDILMIRPNYLILATQSHQTSQSLIYILNSKIVMPINIKKRIKRLLCSDNKIYVIFEEGGIWLLDTQTTINQNQNENENQNNIDIQYQQYQIHDYCQIDNQVKFVLCQGNLLVGVWVESEREFVFQFGGFVEGCCGHRVIKVGRNILIAHRNNLIITHFILHDQSFIFIANHCYYQEKLKAGIISIQNSQDQMHAALAVEVIEKDQTKIQNFIFNLSSISKSHKFMNPFTRLVSMSSDISPCIPLENAISSNSYILIGSKIYNLYYSTSLERKKIFNLYEVPKFFAVHPLGHQFLCGFDSIIKFYNKIQKDVHEVWSQQYMCTAAKYSKSGGLVLSCIEDSTTVLIIYDCYNFRKIRNIPIPFLKFYATKIEWVSDNSAIVLYCNTEFIKINVFSGQKISEYKDKKDSLIKCIDYDSIYDSALAGNSLGNLIVIQKADVHSPILNSSVTVNFPQQISSIRINHGLKAVFFGSKNGTLYWCSYPLKIKKLNEDGYSVYSIGQEIERIKLHNQPICMIDFTSNNKFMLVNVKSQGYFSFRIRKIRTKDTSTHHMSIAYQELGNPMLNTIDTSSTTNYSNNKQKLKISLQKRKQCFNDLEEFRRQWQLKLAFSSKQIQMRSKQSQLLFINETLSKIEQIKQKKKTIQLNISKVRQQLQQKKNKKQQQYTKQMLSLYSQQQKQQQILKQTKHNYQQQYQKLVQECSLNLKQIQTDLQQKRNKFENNYKLMISNLQNFKRRFQYQKVMEPQERMEEIQEYFRKLEIEEILLNKESNQLSIKITQCKKQYQRYINRKGFLEYKNIFFAQENSKCGEEKTKLLDLKEKFESQLRQLQIYTDKKQKKLRVYLKANQALRKYKQIHENLSQNSVKQAQFIKQQQQKIDLNIVSIQKQLSSVASSNQIAEAEIKEMEAYVERLKGVNHTLQLKTKDIGFYLIQILGAMDNIGYYKDEKQKLEKLRQIYNYFYVQRNVQSLIEKQTKVDANFQKNLLDQKNEKFKIQQSKILGELKDQKQYILSNIQVFKNYNNRVKQEIDLNYLQIQAQNYNLIAECNLRKEQTANKKKALHDLIDSVKQTQIYLDELRKEGGGAINAQRFTRKGKKVQKHKNQIPFVVFEKQKQEKAAQKNKCGQASIQSFQNWKLNPQKAFHGNTNIRKMLDIRSIGQNQENSGGFRRIQTAKIKKTTQVPGNETISVMKPLTATLKRRYQRSTLKSALSIKNKSSSKPSTCATFSQPKCSFAH